MPQDSTGKPIAVGDRVRFRGRVYTITAFRPGQGRFGSAAIEFDEPCHTTETPDEVSVDFVGRNYIREANGVLRPTSEPGGES
jgi:hypothetical protein